MTSPTARTLAELRRLGYLAEVVERWVPQARIRRDMYGFVDVVGMMGGFGLPRQVLCVQCTSGTNHADRVAKVRAHPNLATVLGAGATVEVWSWSKRGPKGKRKLWTLRREEITAASAAPTALLPADRQPLSATQRRPGRPPTGDAL